MYLPRTIPPRAEHPMAHLELVAIVVQDYDSAIDFFVRCLRFELIEDTAPVRRPRRILTQSR